MARSLTDAKVTRQTWRLQEQIKQLLTVMQALSPQRKHKLPTHVNVNPQEESDNEEDYLFTEHSDNNFNRITEQQEQIQQLTMLVKALTLQTLINLKPPEEESNNEVNQWEQRFKCELPEFHGGESAEELFDWIFRVEEILDFKRVPLERCVPIITMKFREQAAAWWTQLKSSRGRLDKPKILSWEILKKKMRKTFLPFNYDQLMLQRLHSLQQETRSVKEYSTEFFLLLRRVDDLHDSEKQIVARFVGGLRQKIQHSLNLLNPLTIAEAHQQALTVEAQNALTVEAQNKGIIWPTITEFFQVDLEP